jgi:cell division protease FtsH
MAEALILDSVSTGAANDLEHVSNMAYRMVTEFGFSKTIGPFSYAGLPERDRRGAEYPEVIAEAREIAKGLERECAALLRENRTALERLTAELLEHETVTGEVVRACVAAARAANRNSMQLAA